ncbi:MAG: sigma-70 family RNA polymerase sigma factor [Aggregatilineales bacterium]
MSLEATNEHLLIARARRGDTESFRALYARYFPRVYAYIAYRVGRAQDAEDITAEVFAKAVAGLARFEDRGAGAFGGWLFRIAHNQIALFYRQQRRAGELFALDELPDIQGNDLPLDLAVQRKEQFARLRALILALAPRRREVVLLRFFGGLRNQEIAEALGLDERTVAAHLSRGLDDLRRRYLPEPAREGRGPAVTDNHHRDCALLDDLARTVPQADPAFRDHLEAQLLAQLQPRVSDRETDTMQMISMYPHPTAQETDRPARRAPLTLAAALLMVILAGSALLFMNRPAGAPDLFAAAQQQTATPVIEAFAAEQITYVPQTPTPMDADAEAQNNALRPPVLLTPTVQAPSARVPEVIVVTLEATVVAPIEVLSEAPAGYVPVVIAAQDIARGTAITPDLLAVVYWPLDLYWAAVSSLGADAEDLYSAVEQAAGLYANADIPRFQPVLAADLAPQQQP